MASQNIARNTELAMQRGSYSQVSDQNKFSYATAQRDIRQAQAAIQAKTTEANFYKELVAAQTTDARTQATRENSAREATVRFWKNSKGEGVTRDPVGIDFGITFLEEPSFTQGAANSKNHEDENFGDAYGGATVRYWIRNQRGHYLGAFMTYWSRVNETSSYYQEREQAMFLRDAEKVNKIALARASLQFELVHSLAFTGFGYKAPSPALINEIEVIQPRIISYS